MILLAAFVLLQPPTFDAVNLHITPTEMNRIAMNDRGTIVGTRLVTEGKYEGFVYLNGRLHSVGGDTPWAGGINARDEAVFMGGGKVALWRRGRSSIVYQAKPGAQAGAAGIDDKGHIAGSSFDFHATDGAYEVFFYPRRKKNPFLGKRFQIARINNVGQFLVADMADHPNGYPRMYLWSERNSAEIKPANPDATPEVMGLNDTGLVIGVASARKLGTMDSDHAFRWQDGKYADLPVFTPNRFASCKALAINNRGQIVGSCNWMLETGGDAGIGPQTVATLWMNDQVYDLNKLLASKEQINLFEAVAVNNRGQILAIGQARGQTKIEAFLLSPKPKPGPY